MAGTRASVPAIIHRHFALSSKKPSTGHLVDWCIDHVAVVRR
jgi:hypothetical protein